MVSSTHSADSPGWMMLSTGWSLGKHTQDGVTWSGTQTSVSAPGRGTLFPDASSLDCKGEAQKSRDLSRFGPNVADFRT